MPALARRSGDQRVISWPSNCKQPALTGSSPDNRLRNVVLPAAVRSDDGVDFAGLNLERHVAHRVRLPKFFDNDLVSKRSWLRPRQADPSRHSGPQAGQAAFAKQGDHHHHDTDD